MHVQLHISVAGLTKKQRQVSLELPEGATISQALAAYEEKYVPDAGISRRGLVPLRNRTAAKFSDSLADGDEVKLLRVSRGG